MLGRLIDSLRPTRRQPTPVMESAPEAGVLFDRGAAAVIDLVLCYVFLELPAFYAFSVLFPAAYEGLGDAGAALSLALLLPLYISYSFLFEWLYGRTPGKVNRRLVVVTTDGGECTLRASAVRNLFRYVDLLGIPPLLLGLLVAFVANGQRLGDVAAATVVVRARAPAGTGYDLAGMESKRGRLRKGGESPDGDSGPEA